MITDPTTLYLLHIIYLIALAAEAMTAALAAGRRSMDWVGVILLACITGLGGGSVRDLVLDNHPLSWVGSPELLLVTGGAAVLTIVIARHMYRLKRLFLFLDAVGLVVFSIIGSNIAIGLDQPFLVVVAAGMITGCVGGVLRDILCNDVPLLFHKASFATDGMPALPSGNRRVMASPACMPMVSAACRTVSASYPVSPLIIGATVFHGLAHCRHRVHALLHDTGRAAMGERRRCHADKHGGSDNPCRFHVIVLQILISRRVRSREEAGPSWSRHA